MKDLDVFLEVQSAGQLLGVDEDPVPVAGRLLSLAEQNRPETHRQVLTGHFIHLVMGRHTLQVIQKLPQGRLEHKHTRVRDQKQDNGRAGFPPEPSRTFSTSDRISSKPTA